MKITVRCPAKINRFLAVGPVDLAGYHPLRTIFQEIDLCDQLIIETSQKADDLPQVNKSLEKTSQNGFEQDQITSNWNGLPLENTLTKVLRLAREIYPIPPLRIYLEKKIPSEAGLGGGSSNAAGLLRALPKILGLPISIEEQSIIAKVVGKDVPFFLHGGLAQGEKYGDEISALQDREETWILLLKPNLNISTQKAYQDLDQLQREWKPFPDDLCCFYNDFEKVMPKECATLKKELLNAGAERALLAGSGSAVFGEFQFKEEAEEAQRKILNLHNLWSSIAKTLNRSECLLIS